MNSHPAACLAAAKAFESKMHTIPSCYDFGTHCLIDDINSVVTNFIHDNANSIMKQLLIEYFRNAELCDKLFNDDDTSEIILSVCTNFFINHAESLEALSWVQQGLSWSLDELLDGHKFLLIIKT